MIETLSPRQRAAVIVLADPQRVAELGTLGRLAGACKVNVRTLRRWYAIPEFGAAIREEAGRHLDAHLGRIYEAMIERAVGGNVAAARLVLECRGIVGGRAAPAVSVNVNEAPEVVLSWARVEGRSEDEDLPRRDPEDELLAAVALEERQRTGGQVIDAAEDSARRAAELRRRAELEEERAERARREEEAEREAREKALHGEILRRTEELRASEPYETRPIEDW
jgi:hypothetical protein